VNLIGKTNQHDVLVVAILGVAFGLSFLAFITPYLIKIGCKLVDIKQSMDGYTEKK